jgi:hypothetical protein
LFGLDCARGRQCLSSTSTPRNDTDSLLSALTRKTLAFRNTGKLRSSGFFDVLPIRNAPTTPMWQFAHQQTGGRRAGIVPRFSNPLQDKALRRPFSLPESLAPEVLFFVAAVKPRRSLSTCTYRRSPRV